MSRNYKPKTSLLDAILGEEVSGMTSFGKVVRKRTSFILEVFSIDVSENTIKAKTIATVISVLSFLIGYFIYSQLFKANYEMPPEVDSENVNLY